MNRYDFYPGDWQRDTSDLTILEDGIYRRLIDWYYSNERPIPNDRAEVIVKCSTDDERKKTQWVLTRFFKKEPIGSDYDGLQWRSDRCDREIEKAQIRINAARLNGKKGGRPPKNKPKKNPVGYPVANPDRNPEKSSPSPSPSSSLRGKTPKTPLKSDSTEKELLPPSSSSDLTSETVTKKSGAKGAATWDAYSVAYSKRYGVQPVRNKSTNIMCCNLVKALGEDEAPAVAAFYLTSNNSYYVQRGHNLNVLVADANKIRTEYLTGRRVTQSQAREADRMQGQGDGWRRVIERRGE